LLGLDNINEIVRVDFTIDVQSGGFYDVNEEVLHQ